jgi:Zn-dependent alcohol dehydrogenase
MGELHEDGKLDHINEGYDDMLAGRNIRGVVIHDH